MDIAAVIKSKIEALTSVSAYPNIKPVAASIPAIVYTLINNDDQMTHAGYANQSNCRMQLTFIAGSYSANKTLIDSIRSGMLGSINYLGNSFVVTPTNIHRETVETGDVYVTTKDYFIQYPN